MTDDEAFFQQIKYRLVEFDTTSKIIAIRLTEVNDSLINGIWLNGSSDTLQLTLNSGYYMDFVTEVKINGRWQPFQINQPFSCGMGIGKGRLFPNYRCKISLNRSTLGAITLPFRLKLQVGKRKIVSNEIEISCTEEQFKMIPKKIKDFTW